MQNEVENGFWMFVNGRRGGLSISTLMIYWDFHIQPFSCFPENGLKNDKVLSLGRRCGEHVVDVRAHHMWLSRRSGGKRSRKVLKIWYYGSDFLLKLLYRPNRSIPNIYRITLLKFIAVLKKTKKQQNCKLTQLEKKIFFEGISILTISCVLQEVICNIG